MKYEVTVAGQVFEIEVRHNRLVEANGRPLYVDLEQVGGLPVYSLTLDDMGYVVFVEEGQGRYQVEVQGKVFPVEVVSQRPRLTVAQADCPSGEGKCMAVSAPLAGRLIDISVGVGDRVDAGQTVAVVEAMKMKMEIKASQAGAVEAVHGSPERDVSQGEKLITIRSG
jgi:biotin carboxyl carrier protein